MSKARNSSISIIPKRKPSDYLSPTKLLASARPDPTNPDWVAIQHAAQAGDVKTIDNLLSSPATHDVAKLLALKAIFTLPLPLPNETSDDSFTQPHSHPSSILYLLGAEGYVKILGNIIDAQLTNMRDLEQVIYSRSALEKATTINERILLDLQDTFEVNITNLLAIAVNHGRHQLIELIHTKCGDHLDWNNFNITLPYANTLLAIAAKLNHFLVVKKLLQYKADPNAGNGKTEMALIYAILNGNIEMAQLLIKNGANLNVVSIHRGSKVDENGKIKFLENTINVDEAIKLAPDSAEMAQFINDIRARGEFFKREMEKGDSSPLVQNLIDWHAQENIVIEEEIIGQN